MDSRNINKHRRQKNKNKKPYSWKIINQLVESTSDQDSDGTTGSIGGERIRDSSQCSTNTGGLSKKSNDSLPIVTVNEKESDIVFACEKKIEHEKKTTQPTIQNGEKKKKRGRNETKLNYVHKNNDKINSMINALLVAALLIVSGLASGHYIATHSRTKLVPTRVSTTILNRYVNKTIEMYEKLLDENKELREKIHTLEHSLESDKNNGNQDLNTKKIEHIEKDIIQGFIKFIEKEIKENKLYNKENDIENTIELMDDIELDIESPTTKKIQSFSDYKKDEDEFKQMIEKAKLLQRRLKRKKLIKDENIAKNEKVKNNQENSNGNDTFFKEKERVKETIDAADYVVTACKVCSEPNLNHEKKRDISTHSTNKHKINKNGYVNNIRKLFEPDSETCPQSNDINDKLPNDMNIKSTSSSTQCDINSKTSKTEKPEEKSKTNSKKETKNDETIPLNETCSILDNLGLTSSDINNNSSVHKPEESSTTQIIDADNDTDKYYSEEFELESQYISDTKSDIRNSKRKQKNRSNEGGNRIRKKVKPQRNNKSEDELIK